MVDENIDHAIVAALRHRLPYADILAIGDDDAPARGTKDPDILVFLEASQRILITNNRRSIPGHIVDHAVLGGQHWGVAWIRADAALREIVDTIELIWEADDSDEWYNRTDWIPY